MSTSQEPMITALEEMSGSEEESLELSPLDTHVLLDGVIRALEARHKALQMELRGWKEHSIALKKTVDNLQVSLEEFKNSIADIQDEKIPDNEEMVKKLIQEELSLYDADKTGLPDYALESVGGAIVSTPDTMTYKSEEWHHFWGLILWREMDYYPRYVIQHRILLHIGVIQICNEYASVLGMCKVEFIGSELAFVWRENSKPFMENHPQYT
ncbi:unnamed protein product [Timema podura]|uniref:Uncharacterized protein n=1 Tax=Timema podura TaxID=61482 RepID=A0ABN7PBA4_TIMPD|nr:unnamed protein product [Timema podura]